MERKTQATGSKRGENTFSDSQSRLGLDDGRDAIGAVSIRNGGVLLGGVVAEQKHLFAVESVFRPGDFRQRARGYGTLRIVRVLMVDEVDDGISANADTCETVKLRKLATVNGADIEEVLPPLPQE